MDKIDNVEKRQLGRDVMAFATAAVIALVDGRIDAKEAEVLLSKGQTLMADLGAALRK